ncbi:MAG: hypothetical protein C3F17_20180 [Bradyrhizobiaceae bacterium]|nr:MAG: hypothetical protein C3F17_20180 [Bradyrhizobiaceae bacterium]
MLAWILPSVVASAQSSDRPRLTTNQAQIEDWMRETTLAIDDPMAVFAFVLASLPGEVTVYPSEGYYYFGFSHGGVNYSGNIRLDASDRDAGALHFAYFEEMADWRGETPTRYRRLDATQGVAVERLARLVYRVTHRDKSVVFRLNDLSDVKPPEGAVAPHERLIGPMFDESGLRFFLVYNPRVKNFHYVLDETARVADAFTPVARRDRILIGKRTGFAFYRDHRRARKILIGVFDGNARVNNHLDGPFDQLPDSIIEGETLREALIEMDPTLAGEIDRFGGSPDGEFRYMIAPYLHYAFEDELHRFDRCATRRRGGAEAAYYRCFVTKRREDGAMPGPPREQGRKPGKGR